MHSICCQIKLSIVNICTYSIQIYIASNKAIINTFIRFSSVCHVPNFLALDNITQKQLKYIGLFSITIVFISLHDSVANDKSILIFMCMMHSFGWYYTQYQIHNNLIFRTENQHEGFAWNATKLYHVRLISIHNDKAKFYIGASTRRNMIFFYYRLIFALMFVKISSMMRYDRSLQGWYAKVPTKVKHSAHIHMCNLSV